jgi:integrase
VREHLPEPLRPVITFAFLTGWRIRSEVLRLKWKDVDFRHGAVTLPPGSTKNRKGRVFPFTQELRAVLELQRECTRKIERKAGVVIPFVFHRNGSPIRDFYHAWRTACRKAGVPLRVPHDFRRTAVRNLVRAGIPERVAMQMTGHLTRSIFDRYHIVSEGDLQDAARRLDAVRRR